MQEPTTEVRAARGTFAAFLRHIKPGDEVVLNQYGVPTANGVGMPACNATNVVRQILRAGNHLTGQNLRELQLSGVFGAIGRGQHDDLADLPGEARKAMQARYKAAPVKGMALIIRAKSGAIKGILDGQDHYVVERLSLGLVNVGGYYPAYVVTRNVQNLEGGHEEMKFLVPLHFQEEVRTRAQAKYAFGQPLAYAYVEQAVQYAAQQEAAMVAA